jgi:hypothetical protein
MSTSDHYETPARHAGSPGSDPAPLHEDPRDRPSAGYSADQRAAHEQEAGTPIAGSSPTPDRASHDTSTVPATERPADRGTGAERATGDAPVTAARERDAVSGDDRSNKLFSAARAHDYSARWTAVKGEFVDEPRRAVGQADHLVGELLDELHETFSRQRRSLDHGLDTDETTTEDLRVALGRYRDFFDRLLSL